MKDWLVVFRSDASPGADLTCVRVRERSALCAVAKARREAWVSHPWSIAQATPWPLGQSFEAVARRFAAR